MTPARPDDESIVRTLLAVAGLAPTDEEIVEFTATYARMRPMIESLYALDAAHDEYPALRFDAEPPGAAW